MSARNITLPRWVDIAAIPLTNVLLAFLVAGVITLAIGENPLDATQIMISGALAKNCSLCFIVFLSRLLG